MVVLALDTTTAAGSVALADDARVLEVAALDPSQPVATRVPGDLAALLDRHGMALPRIDLFAVATGPGSFTGLRIGIATMQGLALARRKPLVGVSTFEALASFADAPHVGVWIDAWRGEVYAATFAKGVESPARAGGLSATAGASAKASAPKHAVALRIVDEPRVDSPDALLAAGATPTIFIGDGAVRYRDRLPRVVEPTPLLAGAVAMLARARAEAGELPPPHAIRPLYVRRPDAELAKERR